MSLIAVTPELFGTKQWITPKSFHFATTKALLEITASELPRAACHFPVGLLAQEDGAFMPVALMGIQTGKNLFVAKDGSWLAGHVPNLFQAAPFSLGVTEQGEKVLCIDDTIPFAPEQSTGHPFFGAGSEPSAALLEIWNFLSGIDANRIFTRRACAALVAAGLVQPWQIEISTQGGVRRLEGLHHISQEALDQLDGTVLKHLLDVGALPLAYCQLVSGQHLGHLGRLADAHAALDNSQKPSTPNKELDLSFLSKGGTLGFGNLI